MDKIFKKELNITFVYIFIFLVGMAIVFLMTNYINNAVDKMNNEVVAVEK